MSTIPASTPATVDEPGLHSLTVATNPRPKRWTREEYHRLAEQGYFDGRRVELINGEILEVSPQSPQHRWSILQIVHLLEAAFGEGHFILPQGPVSASDRSEPEPDLSVHAGSNDDYIDSHPTTALLAVEISKTTQRFDKTTKADLYASAKIEDYWVLDLDRRELTVFRKPAAEATSPFGWRYTLTEVIAESGEVSPLAAPGASLKIASMLPPTQNKRQSGEA